MSAIAVENLQRAYQVADKAPGLAGTLSHFWQRQYRTIWAVRDVSFAIAPGEVVGFLGANGAGKTTTLKMLTGLIQPTGGTVQVGGFVPFRRQRPFLHQITLVMGQKQQLLWDLPALDSLRINGAVYGLSDRLFAQRLAELSELLELTDKLRQPVRKLSLGERMKAELLAALLHHPRILFLDEPTLGLDVNAQVKVRAFLREYNARYGATILLTSHYMADITALCQRVLLIHGGRLIFDGRLEDLVEKCAPYREVRLELEAPPTAAQVQRCQEFGKIQAIAGCQIRLLLERGTLPQVVSQMLSELAIADVTITDPPIEEVIGQVFTMGTDPISQP
jgi:ABC-2 type transport system ATP-binding protein